MKFAVLAQHVVEVTAPFEFDAESLHLSQADSDLSSEVLETSRCKTQRIHG